MNYFKVFMDIDEQLINQNKAGELREEKRGGTLETEETEENKALSTRELVQRKKTLLINNEKRAQELVYREKPFRKMTDGMLKFAWENLITSWGLTLFWIDIHVFLNKVLGPQDFRELGEEWVPASIKKLGEEKTKAGAAMLRILESAGCGCLNLGCLFLVISVLAISAMIVSAAVNPWNTLWSILTGDGSLSGFIDMIKSLW